MQLEEAILNRRSVREYTSEAVGEATVKRLIAAAVQAPSAINKQPWTFTVIRDRRLLEQVSHAAKLHMLATTSPQEIEVFRSQLEDPQFEIFYHAPALIVISGRSAGPWITEDCALAAENLMLAAYAEQLGTCWIGFAQAYLNTAERGSGCCRHSRGLDSRRLLLSSEDHSMRPGLSVVRTRRFAGWVEQPFVWKVTHSKDGSRTRLNESLREEHARPIRAVAGRR